MRNLILSLLILIPFYAKPCGWSPETDSYYYFNLFEQTNISSHSFYPFLKENYNTFYTPEEVDYSKNGNIILWKVLLPDWKDEDIHKAQVTESDFEFYKLWARKTGKLNKDIQKYMEFARKCSRAFAYRQNLSWSYNTILEDEKIDVEPILEKGLIAFQYEENSQLKLRYAYQIVRIYHYTQRYNEAIEFYTSQVENNFYKNEIYYYTLDQIAGCYYSLEDYEKAAYLFLTVFNKSQDRKTSAFLSYAYCTNKGADGKSLFTNSEDESAYLTLKGIRSFSDNSEFLIKLYDLDPNDPKVELLFIRDLNTIEREVWPTRLGLTSTKTLPDIEGADKQEIDKLNSFVQGVLANKDIANRDFWYLSDSYLSFILNHNNEAKQKLLKVKGKALSEQKDILGKIYEVFSWEKISESEEEFLASVLSDIIEDKDIDYWDDLSPDWKYVIMDKVANLYYKEGKLAKSFLIHNRIEKLERLSAPELVDNLILFVGKKEKNSFEKLLMKKTENIADGYSANDYLNLVKGIYYLQEGKHQLAYTQLNETQNDKSVSGWIFSNNTKEGFDLPKEIILEDSVFLSSAFSFINHDFGKGELAENLVKLDSLTENTAQWKRKLAHYLLGNYYFNISNTGYYRGTLTSQSNCCNHRYFPYNHTNYSAAGEIIRKKEGYNLLDVKDFNISYFAFAEIAYNHYESVIENSKDKELNARCLYMMAKCELNSMYNSSSEFEWGYEGDVNNLTQAYKESFRELKDNYGDTKFYSMILKECSFFRYYCSI